MTALTLATLALRITLILGVVGIINSGRRRSSAGSRHWLWMLALAGVSILPLTARVTPPLRVVPWNRATEIAAPSVTARQSTLTAPELVSDERNVPAVTSPVIPDVTIAAIQPVSSSIDVSIAIAAIWILGTLLLIGRLIHAHVIARRVLRNSYLTKERPVESVPIRFSTEVDMPFTYGLVKPVIILPADADLWSASQMKATLTHEVAHAKRGDGLALLVTQCVVALYWWHPVVWIAARAAAADRERACDDAVLREGMRASEYGQCLLAHADAAFPWKSKPLATVMFGHSAGLCVRVAALLDPAIDRSSAVRPSAVVVAGILGFVVVVGAAAPRDLRTTMSVSSSNVTQKALPLVAASIIPAAPRALVDPVGQSADVEPTVCRQTKDIKHARTYRDATVRITGAGGEFNNGVSREIWTGLDCIAWIQYSGQMEASVDERSMDVISDGLFLAHNEGPDGTLDYSQTGASSSMKLNGKSTTIGPAEQQWIAAMVREYLRRTGKRVHERARHALVAGSIPALLAEAERVPSSEVRAAYLVEGFASTLDGRAAAKFIEDGAALLDSSDSRGRFLLGVPPAFRSDVGVLAAIYREASLIEPDDPVEKVLASTSPPRPLPSALQPWMEKIIDGIQISERRTALRAYYLGLRP
jgi:beta-lactamase regulating signal transducer with metallopeptidase domain